MACIYSGRGRNGTVSPNRRRKFGAVYEHANDGSTAYVFLGDNIEYNGNFCQWWAEYYINAGGDLVSRFLLFNPEPRKQFGLDRSEISVSANGPVQLP